MLPTLGAPSKKSTPEQQMAMMRTYLNQLKDDTEGELYNIRWENLAKPLQDKLNGLDKDIVAQGEQFDYLNANMVTVGYLQANYIAANQLDAALVNSYYLNSQYVYAGSINAAQITAGTINTQLLDVAAITAGCVNADLFTGNYISAGLISASNITAGTLAANRISSDIMRTSQLDADLINSQLTLTDTIIVNGRHYKERAFAYEGANLYILAAPRPY